VRTAEGYWGVPWTAEDVEYLKANYGTVRTKDIAEKLGRSYNAVVLRAKIEGLVSLHRAAMNSLTPGYFKQIDTPVKAYLLGLLAADGAVSDRNQVVLALNVKDADLVAFARDQIAPGGRLGEYQTRTGKMVNFKVQCADLAADLASWGVTPRKSYTIAWPTGLDPVMQRSFLHGYFDGDGSLGRAPLPRWAIVSGCEPFLLAAQAFILAETGIRVGGPYKDKRHKSASSIVATGEPVRALDAWVQQDGLGLARKRLGD
jgi:hypothetical protein